MDSQKVSTILELPVPTDKKSIQTFMRFANLYWRFIKDFSNIISPNTQLTHQHTNFQSQESQTTFDKLKFVYISSCSATARPRLPYVLEVDAT